MLSLTDKLKQTEEKVELLEKLKGELDDLDIQLGATVQALEDVVDAEPEVGAQEDEKKALESIKGFSWAQTRKLIHNAVSAAAKAKEVLEARETAISDLSLRLDDDIQQAEKVRDELEEKVESEDE